MVTGPNQLRLFGLCSELGYDLNPFPGLDLTAFGFALSVLVIAWGLLRLHLFDRVPVAHSTVIESMPDGVVVLDDPKALPEGTQVIIYVLKARKPAECGERQRQRSKR